MHFALIALFLAAGRMSESAEVLFVNGNFYTVADKNPRAQAVAVRDGKIIYVGSNAGARTFRDGGTQVIDLHEATVVPGLTDSHYHLSGVGQREMTLNLEGTSSLEEFLSRVKERVERAKPGEWVTGRGW